MKMYKIKWTLRSALETALQSDTIFGHFCWALIYSASDEESGKEKLARFLMDLENPIFLLSSAFPGGTIPVPVSQPDHVPLPEDLNEALSTRESMKSAKKLQYIPLEVWVKHNQNYRHSDVIQRSDAITKMIESMYKMEQVMIMHSSINRLTGTTTKDAASLYSEPAWFPEKETVFESYLETDYFSISELEQLFMFIELSGFGRNKHTGRGRFGISLEEYQLPKVDNPNAWLVLSNMVSDPDDPLLAEYRGFVKYGKLGGGYAAANRNPFKKPLFILEPGTVFYGSLPPRGSLVRGIHPDYPEICQYAYAMSIGFHVEGGEHAG